MKSAISPLLKKIRKGEIDPDYERIVSKESIIIQNAKNLYLVKEAPYVLNMNIKPANIEKNLFEYLRQVLHFAILAECDKIPFMRHLGKSCSDYLFDIPNTNITNDIQKLIAHKLSGTDIQPLRISHEWGDSKTSLNITVNVDYKGILVAIKTTYSMQDKIITNMNIQAL